VFEINHGSSPTRCAVYAMPGMGKMQLALQYARLSYNQGQYSAIFWISGMTVEKLNQGFCRCAFPCWPSWLWQSRPEYKANINMMLVGRVWQEGPHQMASHFGWRDPRGSRLPSKISTMLKFDGIYSWQHRLRWSLTLSLVNSSTFSVSRL